MSKTSSFSLFNYYDKLRSKFGPTQLNSKTSINFSNLPSHIQTHLKNVYSCLLISVLCTALGAYFPMIGWFNYPPLAFLASIFTIICLCGLDLNAQTQIKCFSFISATAFFTGIYLSPLIALAIVLDSQLVVTAFLMTTIIFLCLTLSVLLTPKLTYLYLGGLLGGNILILLILSLMKLFGQSELIFNYKLYYGLFIACCYILYDTELIIQRATQGDMNYIKHALLLFIDMVELFIRILIILIKESLKTKKKSNNG